MIPGAGKRSYDGDETTLNMVGNLWRSYANNQENAEGDVIETFIYDRLGNVLEYQQVVQDYGPTPSTLSYTYNSAGMLLTITDNETELTVTRSYNPLNQLVRIIGTLNTIDTVLVDYTYTQEGYVQRVDLMSLEAVISRQYQYMPTGWPLTINDDNFHEALQYTTGSCEGDGYYNGAIANQSIEYKTGEILTDDYCFQVDYLNRVAVANSNTSNTWGMDANNNFLTHTINGVTRTYTITADTNQLASITADDDSLNRSYTYTAAGETATVQDDKDHTTLMQLTYSKGNGLPQTIVRPVDDITVSLTYNSDNRRVLKTSEESSGEISQRFYLYGTGSKPTLEVDMHSIADSAKRYIHLPGIRVIFCDGTFYFALQDHLGSTERSSISPLTSLVNITTMYMAIPISSNLLPFPMIICIPIRNMM